jgi:Ca2+-dependent lipid-binding protein
LNGRLSILLCPLTNIIPLIGAAQISFINPPNLKLNFTGAADVADFSLIDGAVRKVLISIINSVLVLPNRIMVKLDANNDYFKTYHQPLGVIRITADRAWGFAEEAQSKTKKLFAKLTRASPDCYAEIEVGAEPAWKTSTKNNTTTPAWGETHDFVVTDYDQVIKVTVSDHDVNSDDEVGVGITTVRDILLAGGKQDLSLLH